MGRRVCCRRLDGGKQTTTLTPATSLTCHLSPDLSHLSPLLGMTMLMVTHDMYLKNFAHRVVWMRDGKIAKIETISTDQRKRALDDLRMKILLVGGT